MFLKKITPLAKGGKKAQYLNIRNNQGGGVIIERYRIEFDQGFLNYRFSRTRKELGTDRTAAQIAESFRRFGYAKTRIADFCDVLKISQAMDDYYTFGYHE